MELGFDCRECDDILRKERGCVEKGLIPFEIDNERVWRCPLKLVESISWEYITAYNFYQKGIMPNGQGWLNENGKFLDAMIVLDNEVKRQEMKERKKNG